jgi:20S proteasome alpha/beta subunit
METLVKTGTTIIGFKFKGGILLAGDTQATGYPGLPIELKSKIDILSDNLAICYAGSAAQGQSVTKFMKYYISRYQDQEYQKVNSEVAAQILSNLINYSGGVEVATILAGYVGTQPRLYEFDSAGFYVDTSISAYGSGSGYSLGILKDLVQPQKELSEKEAIQIAKKALEISKKLDVYTGFKTVITIIKPNNCKFIYN